MPRQVVIIHGWSDTSASFEPLARFLHQNGFEAVPIWLGDYLSMEDDVRVEDVGKRLQEVITRYLADGVLTKPFDIIVHSTGGLVARQWVSAYYTEGNCPARRLVMLAPANFGSVLANMGRSMIGRITKGWGNWFETGESMLHALELASRYQYDLARRDLFAPEGAGPSPSPYGSDKVWPFVISGTHPYPGALRAIVNENGGDGTVRVPSANLNIRGRTIDFSRESRKPEISEWRTRHEYRDGFAFPFAVLPDRTHASVIDPEKPDVPYQAPDPSFELGNLILTALNCESYGDYQALVQTWRDLNQDTASLTGDDGARRNRFKGNDDPEHFHQYYQIVVDVIDDSGEPVNDYFLEFFASDDDEDVSDAVYFHSEVLEHVHVNARMPARRCFFIDRHDLMRNFYDDQVAAGAAKVLCLSISAQPPGPNIRYFEDITHGARQHVVIHGEDGDNRWLKRNSTHFIRIVIPRNPADGVFTLRRAPQ